MVPLPRPRSSCLASTSSIARRSKRRSRLPASSAATKRARLKFARFACSNREPGDVTDIAWIDAALRSARPQAIGALLRYFRDLDQAEEAFQEASLRALKSWPINGPPRDPTAWLILVGRNFALDDVRRRSKS